MKYDYADDRSGDQLVTAPKVGPQDDTPLIYAIISQNDLTAGGTGTAVCQDTSETVAVKDWRLPPEWVVPVGTMVAIAKFRGMDDYYVMFWEYAEALPLNDVTVDAEIPALMKRTFAILTPGWNDPDEPTEIVGGPTCEDEESIIPPE